MDLNKLADNLNKEVEILNPTSFDIANEYLASLSKLALNLDKLSNLLMTINKNSKDSNLYWLSVKELVNLKYDGQFDMISEEWKANFSKLKWSEMTSCAGDINDNVANLDNGILYLRNYYTQAKQFKKLKKSNELKLTTEKMSKLLIAIANTLTDLSNVKCNNFFGLSLQLRKSLLGVAKNILK